MENEGLTEQKNLAPSRFKVPLWLVVVAIILVGSGAAVGIVLTGKVTGEIPTAVGQALLIKAIDITGGDSQLPLVNDDSTEFTAGVELNVGDLFKVSLALRNDSNQALVGELFLDFPQGITADLKAFDDAAKEIRSGPHTWTFTLSPTQDNVTDLIITIAIPRDFTPGFYSIRGTLRQIDRDLSPAALPPPNIPPVVNPQSVTTPEDAPILIAPTGSDANDDPLTFSIVTPPTNGTLGSLSSSGPTLATVTYTPNPDFFGTDSFIFKANDGVADSAPATVSIIVTPVADPPVAIPQDSSPTTPEDTSVVITLEGYDVDGDGPLSFSIVTPPSHGTLSAFFNMIFPAATSTVPGLPPSAKTTTVKVTYTPNVNFFGIDIFKFTVKDSTFTSAPATVKINVTPVNDPPVAVNDTATVGRNSGANTINVLANDTDVDGDALTITAVTQPANGTVAIGGGGAHVVYTPNANFISPPTDIFTYTLSDGASGSATGTVTITVVPMAELSITKADSPDPVVAGSNLTYSITVTNNGPDAAPSVVITDTLPSGITFVSVTSSQGSCSGTSTVTCNLGTINNGATSTVTILIQPTTPGNISNTASVTSSAIDPNNANNSTTASTAVQPAADLSITKADSPDPVVAGSNLTYAITVTNNGPNAATSVVVTDTLPAGVTFVSSTPSQGSCSGTSTVNCNLGTINPSSTASVTIVVNPTTPGTISNTASVTSGVTDPNNANNNATASTAVQ